MTIGKEDQLAQRIGGSLDGQRVRQTDILAIEIIYLRAVRQGHQEPAVLFQKFTNIRQLFRVLALQFLPPVLRDWLVLLGGAALVVLSLVQLNKILLRAFARRDAGAGLAGLLRR